MAPSKARCPLVQTGRWHIKRKSDSMFLQPENVLIRLYRKKNDIKCHSLKIDKNEGRFGRMRIRRAGFWTRFVGTEVRRL